jgi:integrase
VTVFKRLTFWNRSLTSYGVGKVSGILLQKKRNFLFLACDSVRSSASIWVAKQVVKQNHQFAFPKYCNETKCNANSASAALNKWLKLRVPDGCVIHSFRHSLRDRLRAVECPADIIDAIGGWTTEGVGHQYGKGHSLPVTHGWMKKLQT